MKTKFILLATALFCLASCNNAELDNNAVDLGGSSYVSPSGAVYTIEIEGSDPLTKGAAALQSLGIANLETDSYTKKPKATLYKNKVKVDGASYTWSLINSGGSYISLDKASSQQATLTAKAVKSQANLVHVKGTDGVGSAEIDVPVVVADNFNIDWSESSMTLSSGGKAQPNTVITNAKEKSVKIICPPDCKIGTSKSNLGTSDITVNTGSDGKIPVYVQYTGTLETTLNLQATSGNHSAESSIAAKKEATYVGYKITNFMVSVFDSNGQQIGSGSWDGKSPKVDCSVNASGSAVLTAEYYVNGYVLLSDDSKVYFSGASDANVKIGGYSVDEVGHLTRTFSYGSTNDLSVKIYYKNAEKAQPFTVHFQI